MCNGLVAQRITRLTTDQKIAGSNPAEIEFFFHKTYCYWYSRFIIEYNKKKCWAPPGGLEPPTFRLTAERANQLRHGGLLLTGDFLWWAIYRVQVIIIVCYQILGYLPLRYGLVVRIAGSHPAGPGSIPGNGNLLNFLFLFRHFYLIFWLSRTVISFLLD